MPEQYRLFKEGESWPPVKAQVRNAIYKNLRDIYALSQKTIWNPELKIDQTWRFVPSALPVIIIHGIRNWLFQNQLKIEWPNETQDDVKAAVDRIIEETDLQTVLWLAKADGGITGDIYIRVAYHDDHPQNTEYGVVVDYVKPEMVFPEFLLNNDAIAKSNSIGWTGKKEIAGIKTDFLFLETYEPGRITLEKFKLDSGNRIGIKVELDPEDPPEFTKVPENLNLLFHLQNQPTLEYYGASDISVAVQNPIKEIVNRQTRKAWVLDVMGRPILVVPEKACERQVDPKTGETFLKIPSEAIVIDDLTKAEQIKYLTWDANTQAVDYEMDRYRQEAFLAASVSPTALGIETKGGVASGHALEVEMAPMLTLINTIKRIWQTTLGKLLYAAQVLEVSMGGARYIPTKCRVAIETGVPISRDTQATIIQKVAPHLPKHEVMRAWLPDANAATIDSMVTSMAGTNGNLQQRLQARRMQREQPTQGEQQ